MFEIIDRCDFGQMSKKDPDIWCLKFSSCTLKRISPHLQVPSSHLNDSVDLDEVAHNLDLHCFLFTVCFPVYMAVSTSLPYVYGSTHDLLVRAQELFKASLA